MMVGVAKVGAWRTYLKECKNLIHSFEILSFGPPDFLFGEEDVSRVLIAWDLSCSAMQMAF